MFIQAKKKKGNQIVTSNLKRQTPSHVVVVVVVIVVLFFVKDGSIDGNGSQTLIAFSCCRCCGQEAIIKLCSNKKRSTG
jgi:hypothetical protein